MTNDGRLDALVRRIPDHPKPGILFYDLMPLFQDPDGLDRCVRELASSELVRDVDAVLAIEARGFIVGGALARELGVGLVAARKPGKLPWDRVSHGYALEYGTDVLELHRDAVSPGQRVFVHDDVLATGGTAAAACSLVEALGGSVAGVGVIVELDGLGGREALANRAVEVLLRYPA